ncbi:9642_t:CDS:2 [Gigaspora margarita]|uniref:9642_t:CDS:1 n=1 Tax=Gigaspora margarita TaxID=4874 RepID=A0ABN7V7C8_GIGMA|nr:9642_t:CDS:2 [Gigaspora margarita]
MEEQDLNQELNIEINKVIDNYNLLTSIDYNYIIIQIDNLIKILLRLKLGYLDDKEKRSNCKVIVEKKDNNGENNKIDIYHTNTPKLECSSNNYQIYGSSLKKSTDTKLFDKELSYEPTDKMLIVNKTALEQDRELVKEIDAISKTPKEQDTNTKEQIKETDT